MNTLSVQSCRYPSVHNIGFSNAARVKAIGRKPETVVNLVIAFRSCRGDRANRNIIPIILKLEKGAAATAYTIRDAMLAELALD
jgi:hypothetical protein